MTTYNVHIYREMRLMFEGIEADSPEAAAEIARDKPTGDADSIDDCDGETFAALVDVASDECYRHSRGIDFEARAYARPSGLAGRITGDAESLRRLHAKCRAIRPTRVRGPHRHDDFSQSRRHRRGNRRRPGREARP